MGLLQAHSKFLVKLYVEMVLSTKLRNEKMGMKMMMTDVVQIVLLRVPMHEVEVLHPQKIHEKNEKTQISLQVMIKLNE